MAFARSEEEVEAYLQHLALKVGNHKTQYGLSNDQVAQVQDDALYYAHLRLVRQALANETAEFTAYKDDIMSGDPQGTAAPYPVIELPALPGGTNPPKPGIEKRNSELYNYFKNHPARTDESLADLGILTAAKTPVSPGDIKPVLSGQPLPDGTVSLAFKKQGQAAVRISKRIGGADWQQVADPTNSPYIDETASAGGNPEKREYRAVCLKDNKPVGQFSDIITVVTTP